jgi:hypothetical protein
VPVLFADSVLGRTWWQIRTDISSLGCIANLLGIAAGALEQTKFQLSQRPFHSPLTLDTWTLVGLLYNLPHCVDVVYGAVSAPKPSQFRWLEFVESSSKAVRDHSSKQLIDMT